MEIQNLFLHFWRLHKKNPLKATEILLYFFLVNEAAKEDWCEVTLPVASVAFYARVSSNSVKEARRTLKDRGLIDYTEGINGLAAAEYRVLDPESPRILDKEVGQQADKANSKQSTKKRSAKKPFKGHSKAACKAVFSADQQDDCNVNSTTLSKAPSCETTEGLAVCASDLSAANSAIESADDLPEMASTAFFGNVATGTLDIVDEGAATDFGRVAASDAEKDVTTEELIAKVGSKPRKGYRFVACGDDDSEDVGIIGIDGNLYKEVPIDT